MSLWHLRDNYDQRMYRQVYLDNEYCVADDLRCQVILDLGANIGTFSRLCCERGAKVFAVEPATANCATLWRNLEGQPNFVLRQCAAMPEEGHIKLFTCGNPTAYSVLKASWDNERTWEEVEARPPASLVSECLSVFGADHIDLCKMDIEGAEYLLIPAYDFAPVRELVIEFHGDFVTDYEWQALLCRGRLLDLGFQEIEWRAIHPDSGWLRLYRGRRA